MENIYSEIESSRKEYFNFYNDYRRGGVGEGEYTSRKEKKEIREEKDKDKASITNILTELVNIQQREHQLLMNDKRSKGLRAKYKRPPSNRLEYFIKEHSHKILTFEQLMIKNFF